MTIRSGVPAITLLLWIALGPVQSAYTQSEERAPKTLRVAASFATVKGPYAIWAKAFTDEINALGAVCMTISASGDAKTQAQHCEYLIDQKIGALALNAVDLTTATNIVNQARARGIPVLAIEHMIPNCELDLLLAVDLEAGGFNQVESLLESSRGGYFLLGDTITRDSLMPLQKGRIRSLSPHIIRRRAQLLGHEWLKTSSARAADLVLTEVMLEKGPPNVVLVTHPTQAVGAIQALSRIGADDDALVSGFQPDLDSCRRIQRGQQHSSLYVSYVELGRRSAQLVYKMSTRMPVQVAETRHNGSLEVPVALITPTLLNRKNVVEIMTRDGIYSRAQIEQ